MTDLVRRLWSEEHGQGMAEYGLILALVAIAVITVLTTMGGKLEDIFTNVNDTLDGAITEDTTTTP